MRLETPREDGLLDAFIISRPLKNSASANVKLKKSSKKARKEKSDPREYRSFLRDIYIEELKKNKQLRKSQRLMQSFETPSKQFSA